MTSLISATFKTRSAAESVLRELESIGVKDNQVSLVLTDETRGQHFNMEESSKIDEGIAAGATAGGAVGVILGSLLTATAIVIPGLNLIVAGSVMTGLAGLGAGAAAGGLIGGLIGAGIPEHEAKIYENEIKNGAVLLAVKPENSKQRDMVKNILEHQDAYHIAA